MAIRRAAIIGLACWLLAAPLRAATHWLARDGVAACVIVLPATAGPVERHAAAELATYLEKLSGAKIAMQPIPASAQYHVFLGTADSTTIPLTSAMRKALPALAPHGFLLAADNDGIRIVGRQPLGVLYGAYALLKTYGNVRWFAPGADFEYCPHQPTVGVPDVLTVSNPSFPVRSMGFVCCNWNSRLLDTWDWLVRNGMTVNVGKRVFTLYRDILEERGAIIGDGGHVFSTLLSDDLFDEHPEYFPLLDGKRRRMLSTGPYSWPQPCTSNPEVSHIMADALAKILDTPPPGEYLIGNNDGTNWCQCPQCAALDPPEEREKHRVGTRYFTLVNQIAAAVYATHPQAKLGAWAYQNFQYPPVGVTPDPRLSIDICVHYRCYRHALTDPHCAPNVRMREILTAWRKFPNVLTTREYDECFKGEPPYLPAERIFCQDIKYYHELGLAGFQLVTAPPDGVYGKTWNRRGVTEMWQATWQLRYLAAQLAWDVQADYGRLVKDMGSKYYGTAWPEMARYREALTRMYEETPGDNCYETPGCLLGKGLEQPGVEVELLRLLDAAETKAAGDAVVLRRIGRDREYFRLCWQGLHRDYIATLPTTVTASLCPDGMVLDGRCDAPAWQQADYVTHLRDDAGQETEPPTYVKILHDHTNWYLAITAMESAPGTLCVNAKRHDGPVIADDCMELAFAAPGADGRMVRIAVNPAGVTWDALQQPLPPDDVAFESGVTAVTRILPDRWTAELRLPATALGRELREGEVWKLYLARHRPRHGAPELTTWNGAAWPAPAAFRPVIVGNTPLLENGDFEDAATPTGRQLVTGWDFPGDRVATGWSFDDGPGQAELRDDDAAAGRQYLRITNGRFHGRLNQPADFRGALRIRLQTRGSGTLTVNVYRYDRKTGKNLPTRTLKTLPLATPVWQRLELSCPCPDDTLLRLAFHVADEIDLDDVTVTLEPK